MTEAVGNLRANLTADWADFRGELTRSGQALGDFGQKFQATAGNIARSAVGIFAGFQVGAFINDSIQAAQAAQEMEGAFRAAFGDSADAAEDWVQRTAEALRLSDTELRGVALQFQNLFAEIAPTNEAAAEASMRFTELARDFAELKNIEPEQAVQLFTRALAGSARGLRQYGIDLSEATVRAEALERGIITQDQVLSQEQATLVRASILMRELGDASGETARQAGDAEATAQDLRREYEQTSEQLGSALLPAMTTLKRFLTDLLQGFTNAARGVAEFIRGNDALLAQAYQINQALQGNFISFQEAYIGVRRYRDGVAEGAGAAAATGAEIRGLTDDTTEYAATLAALAAQTANGGTTGGGRNRRSWAEEHRADIERLQAAVDPAAAAMRDFAESMAIAERAGISLNDRAIHQLTEDAINAAGGIEQFKAAWDTLPESFRQAADEIAAANERAGIQEYRDELKAFADELNDEFNPAQRIEEQVARITEAFEEGLISLDVYKQALREIDGSREAEEKLTEAMAAQAEERDKSWQGVSRAIADVATGTRDLEDAWKDLVLQFIRAQAIEPFLNRLFQGGKNGGGGIVGGGLSGIFGSIFGGGGGILNFGGGKAEGGRVVPGMTYEVGERGKELFTPDQAGTIHPTGSYGKGGTTINVYTPDANSFRASRRQIARTERRAIGAE